MRKEQRFTFQHWKGIHFEDGHIVSEILDPEGERVMLRLLYVYNFAREEIEKRLSHLPWESRYLLDIGTYTGFALELLYAIAQNIFSIDIDENKIAIAKEHLATLEREGKIERGKVNLEVKAAQDIDYQSKFDCITLIEVFGAKLEGEPGDEKEVLALTYEALKPGGTLILTVRSMTAEGFHDMHIRNIGEQPGRMRIYREKVSETLENLFGTRVSHIA